MGYVLYLIVFKSKKQGPACKFLLSRWKSQAVPFVQFGELQM